MTTRAVIPEFKAVPDPAKQPALFEYDEPLNKKPEKKKAKRAIQYSMEALRDDGYLVGKTEHWNPWVPPNGIMQDLFGFIDLVAIRPGEKITGVQVTKEHVPEHIEKIQANKAAKVWLESNGRIVVHHWRELGPKGNKKWTLEVIEVTA